MKEQYFSRIQNPLTIIALFVGLTEIALAIVVTQSNLPENQQTVLVWFLFLFPTLYTIAFFLVLIFRPHNFYGPGDFRSDEAYLAISTQKYAIQALVESADKGKDSDLQLINNGLSKLIVDHLRSETCWYLFKVANKPMPLDDHLKVLSEQLAYISPTGPERTIFTLGFFGGLQNLEGLLIDVDIEIEAKENVRDGNETLAMITLRLSPDAIDLISDKIKSEVKKRDRST